MKCSICMHQIWFIYLTNGEILGCFIFSTAVFRLFGMYMRNTGPPMMTVLPPILGHQTLWRSYLLL